MTPSYDFDLNIVAACQIQILPEIYEQYLGYKEDGYFVEIGAFDGFNWSNTTPLIRAGWSGIMVEPDPTNFENLRRRHENNPKLKLLWVAVDKESGTAKLYQGGSTSTISEETLDAYANIPSLACGGLNPSRFVYVPAVTMDLMLDVHHCPERYDVLSLDVEGAEIRVLEGYTIDRHRPKLAIVETHELNENKALRAKAIPINRYFKAHGYKRIYADTINTIFVDKNKKR